MTALFSRWWFHIWRLPTWKATVYLFAVAFRALLSGGGVMYVLSDMPMPYRAIIAAILGVVLSVSTGIFGLRARLGEDW